MAFSSRLCNSSFSLKVDHSRLAKKPSCNIRKDQTTFAIKGMNTDLFGQHVMGMQSKISTEWSFKGGSRAISGPTIRRVVLYRKNPSVFASWLTGPQIASTVFTLATVAVLPFYTLMVLAPNAELTKKSIESGIPYVVLGLLYAYLLYLSWTPDTIRLMFASQYWLPELSGIAKMFSSEMTLASAWIHLLAVDLFAARSLSSLSLSLSLGIAARSDEVLMLQHFVIQAGRFFMMDWRTMWRPGILFLFAYSFVL